jgi:lysozyme
MPECNADSANVKAFLKLIRYAEHFPDKSDNFYNTLYGGGSFVGFAQHPNKAVTKWGHTSTAAGAYQILYGTWAEAKKKGIVTDFSPAAQDAIAFAKLQSRGALGDVCAGNVDHACAMLASEWTSLPGGKQTRMTAGIARDAFVEFGGTLK